MPGAKLHLALAKLRTRDGDLKEATAHIDAAEADLARSDTATHDARTLAFLKADVAVARGRLAFERGQFRDAARHAETALALSRDHGGAHFLFANIGIQRGKSPLSELRAAIRGKAPPAEAIAALATELHRSQSASARKGAKRPKKKAENSPEDAHSIRAVCDLSKRYLAIAPHGYDATRMQKLQSQCPSSSP